MFCVNYSQNVSEHLWGWWDAVTAKKVEPKLHPQWMNEKWTLQLQACVTYAWWRGLFFYSYSCCFPHLGISFRKNIAVELASCKDCIFMLMASNPSYFFKKQKIPVLYLVKFAHFKWENKRLYLCSAYCHKTDMFRNIKQKSSKRSFDRNQIFHIAFKHMG